MAGLWLDAAERNEGNDAGAMDGDGSRKLLLHDTEGSTIAGAVGAYTANNSWPHLTVDCRRRRVQQHIPFERAARALRNQAGGVQTNREGRYLVQIEIVGFANNRDGSMFGSLADYDWFGSVIVGPICRMLGIPIRSTVRWVSYPDSYGVNASQRLSPSAWDAYEGILAHQHCPENTHGDTGLIDITRILRAAGGSTAPSEEDDMTPDQAKTLDNIAQRLIRMEEDLKDVHGRAPGYFAKDPAATDNVVYYVDASHQSKVSMPVGGALHDLLKFFHQGSGFPVRAVELGADVLDGIPDAA